MGGLAGGPELILRACAGQSDPRASEEVHRQPQRLLRRHQRRHGAACGVAYMMLRQKGEQERIYQILCDTITNSIETLGGMVCDGAKASCAAKIGLAVENALMALELSLAGNVFQPGEGMTMEDPEDTIAAVGRMGRVGMKSTDVEILNIMLGN